MAKVYTISNLYVILIVILAKSKASPYGFSYAKFSGPVSGPVQKIIVADEHHHDHNHVDYIAKPDYQFSYGVDDPKSKVQQNRKEIRHGDTVHGEYSLVEPDGSIRVVKYTADDINGFQAEVITNGKSISYGGHEEEHPVHHQEIPEHHEEHPAHHEEIPIHEDHNESSYAIEHSTEHEGYGGEYQEIKEDDDVGSHEIDDSSY